MSNHLLSTAYIYPVCPLSFNHARIYVIADVYARYERLKGKTVYFPIATHYSGNTAHKVAKELTNELDGTGDENTKKTLDLYTKTYKLPFNIINSFKDPMAILDYFNEETIWELQSLAVEAEYTHKYTTGHPDFSTFVQVIIEHYEKHGMLILNQHGELSLNYENIDWRQQARELIAATEYVEDNQRNVVMASLKNIRSDWSLLREGGYGAVYNGRIVDPMFDSEIFSIFDLYIKYQDEYPHEASDPYTFFNGLFERIFSGEAAANKFEQAILSWLPCEHFICEEHLRNWLAKKAHTESLLFNKKYQTEKYTILGMGLLNGHRMSASRGSAVLSKDLIEKYGGLKARLLLLLNGGQLSRDFNYDVRLEKHLDKLLKRFNTYIETIRQIASKNTDVAPQAILDMENEINRCIEKGNLRKALILLVEKYPNRYKICINNEAYWLVALYNTYIGKVFAPELMKESKEL